MKAVEIIDWLNEKIPISLAENWDNSGLQLGNANKEIKKLGVCFQADLDTIKKAVKAETDFLITHHPLLSPTHNPLKNIINADYEIFRLLMNNNITVFSCHTNWDKAKGGIMETYAKLLKLSNTTTDGFVTTGDIPTTKTNDLIEELKKTLGINNIRVYCNTSIINRVSYSPGAGINKETINTAIKHKAQALISGDAKDGITRYAIDSGLLLIDAGHYGTEHLGMKELAKNIKTRFKSLEVVYIDSEEL
ncbi:MAG TPA: Nif3-like dinuclear metal center hexameric protein [Candidatus Nanoarchaeia archaeon]|nr:Nif3-like dinuclear metal center hexameric protein [Candidatus Nanoarchaeia archaeon]